MSGANDKCAVCQTTLSTGGKIWREMSDRTKLKEVCFHWNCWKDWRTAGFPDLQTYIVPPKKPGRPPGDPNE